MRAFTLTRFGGVENLQLRELPMPTPGPGEVLVRIRALDINPIDLKTRRGEGMADAMRGERPMILGWDLSGEVVRTGPGVEAFHPGDQVFGTVGFPGAGRTYAEYATAPADQLALKPTHISHTVAAAATLSALTAWQALAGIEKGQRVLIHGGAGGVGHYAVQIAHRAGCRVTATAAGSDAHLVRQLGADEVIDYRTQRFEQTATDMDFILDTIGGENFTRSLSVLKPHGTIVLLPSDKRAEAEAAAKSLHIENFRPMLVHSDGEGMRRIASMLSDGSLQARVGCTYAFEQIPQAHENLESGKARGKIVILVE